MDQETLFTATKWDILKILSNESKSPIQLAKLANTSVANVSQQLRLLEMGGFVKSTRVPNRDKGQPRIIYSLTRQTVLFIVLGQHIAEKKILDLTPISSATIRIWSLPESDFHYYLEKAFWTLEQDLDRIHAILADLAHPETPALILFSDDAALKKKYQTLTVKRKGIGEKTFRCTFLSKEETRSLGKSAHVIYDPQFMLATFNRKVAESEK